MREARTIQLSFSTDIRTPAYCQPNREIRLTNNTYLCQCHFNSSFFSSFSGKSHLTPIVTQDRDNGCEDDHQDEINRAGYRRRRTTPEDEDDLEDKEEGGKLNFSLYEKSNLQSIIYPPGKKPRSHGKGGSDCSKYEKVETGIFKGRIIEDEIEKDKKG